MRCGSSVRYPHTKQPETFGDFWFTIIFLPFRGSGRVDPLGKEYTKKTGEPPPFGGDFLTYFEPEFGELSKNQARAEGRQRSPRGHQNTQLSVRGREFDQFGEVFGWVSATDWGRLGRSLGHQRERDRGEIGGEIGDQMRARGDRVGSGRWVGSLVGGWLVVRAVIKSVSVRPLRGRNLARGGADPSKISNSTVRGKQTAQTAQAVRLR